MREKTAQTHTRAEIWLDNGYRFELYIDDDTLDSVSTEWAEAIDKRQERFWLGNWGDAIEVYLYDPRGRIVKTFSEKQKDVSMPDIIMQQVVTYTNI